MKKSNQHPRLAGAGSAVSNRQKPNPEPKTEKGKRLRKGKYTLKDLVYPDQRVVRFPQVQGKTAEAVELLTSAGYHHITVEFQDMTSLSIAIEPDFTFKAAYEYVRRGKPHAKLWPEIRSYKRST